MNSTQGVAKRGKAMPDEEDRSGKAAASSNPDEFMKIARKSIIGLIFTKDKKNILVIKRKDVPIWVLPGGGVDTGESPEEAVIREMLEETRLIVKVTRKAAYYLPVNALSLPTHVFECEVIGGEIGPSDETLAIGFYPLNALPKPFFFLHLDWLNDVLSHPDYIVEKAISQVTYGKLFLYFLKHPLQVIRLILSRLGIPWNS